jgi:hypothetical protein
MVAEVDKCNELLANSTLRVVDAARQFTPDNSKGNDTWLAPLKSYCEQVDEENIQGSVRTTFGGIRDRQASVC